MALTEVNLVCMSGQGSVQTVELMARAYLAQHGKFVASQVFPGGRCKSSPVVSYLKVADRPVHAISANYNPSVLVVFWDGLLNVAAHEWHPVVTDAIGRISSGLIIINTDLAPEEITLPFQFAGRLATVNADAIATKFLRRDPAPVGTCLMGAYAKVTGELDMDLLARIIQDKFPGETGKRNVAAAGAAAAAVMVSDAVSSVNRIREDRPPTDPSSLTEWAPLPKTRMPGHSHGDPCIWRTKIPVCNDSLCQCKGICMSEALCPDNTGFIVRDGLPEQGYRVDTEYCRGCGICAEVCVYGALSMVPEREVLKSNPQLDGISVAPFVRDKLDQST